MRRFPDELLRDHAIAQDVLLVVNVVQEKIERGDPLGQAAFHQVPFAPRDDARDEVERENPLRALVVVINRKGHALAEKTRRGQVAFPREIRRSHFLEGRE